MNAKKNEEEYYRVVHSPLSYKSGRIPSPFPVSTACIALDSINVLPTDAYGNLWVRAQTLYAGINSAGVVYSSDSSWNTTVDDDVISGLTTIGPFNSTALTSGNSYRIVGIQLSLQYIGSELNRAGVFMGCHDFNPATAGNSSVMLSLSQMMDSNHFRTCTTEEGITGVYIPYDESYLEYTKTGLNPDFRHYNILLCLVGGQANANCVLLKTKIIIEYIPLIAQDDQVERRKCFGNPNGVMQFSSDMIIRPLNN